MLRGYLRKHVLGMLQVRADLWQRLRSLLRPHHTEEQEQK
jgi:hypothetical protein